MFKSNRPPPLLDVEDDDQRQIRIGNILERLNTSPSSSKSPKTFPSMISLPVEPPAALLARVRDFLPAISASNEALSRQRREDIDIEHIAHDEHQYIEMNLGLGVFEAKRHRHRPDVNMGTHSPSGSSEDSASDRATDNDSSSESDLESDGVSYDTGESDEFTSSDDPGDDDGDSGSESGSAASVEIKHVSSRPIKPLPRRALSQQVQQLPV